MRYGFPSDFCWGAATASYQIEGGAHEGGRGESIWDRFCHIPGNILDGDTGDIACDHYHRFREDVGLMKRLGLKAYRFSIAWPRVFPNGDGELSADGLAFYDALICELLAQGIEPYITLYHWDLPQALQDQGGWANRATAHRFADYCERMFQAFGDRVKHWITINEPWVAAFFGHYEGRFASGCRDFSLALAVSHNLLLGHAEAVRRYRALGQDGEIGIALNLCPKHPRSADPADALAARRNDGYMVRWFLDPLFKGAYPEDMWAHYRSMGVVLPRVEPGDLEAIAAPVDFLGINYYNIDFTRADQSGPWPLYFRVEAPAGARVSLLGCPDTPEGLTEILVRVARTYAPKKLYVTENGVAYPDELNCEGEVCDDARIDYLERHIMACHDAMAQGVNLKGYFVWSLIDNFEWASGFSAPFGLISLNRPSNERIIKKSGHWYRRIIGQNGL